MKKPSVLQIYIIVALLIAMGIAALATMAAISLNHQEAYCVYYDKDNFQLNYSLVFKRFFVTFFVNSAIASIVGLVLAPVYVALRWIWRKVWK
ncbi:hypothetical protein EHLJMEHL_03912 [Vreelandella titanicae]